MSKVFEKIMYERLYSFFDKKILFHSEQSGFRSKRSTVEGLVEIAEQNRQGTTDTFTCVLLDLRKAFISISHETFLT